MSKCSLIFLFLLFAFTFCKSLKKTTTQSIPLGKPCHFFKWCCSDYVCKDYRCAQKGTKDNQIEWAPEGIKCDWFHRCKQNFNCDDNRCVLRSLKE